MKRELEIINKNNENRNPFFKKLLENVKEYFKKKKDTIIPIAIIGVGLSSMSALLYLGHINQEIRKRELYKEVEIMVQQGLKNPDAFVELKNMGYTFTIEEINLLTDTARKYKIPETEIVKTLHQHSFDIRVYGEIKKMLEEKKDQLPKEEIERLQTILGLYNELYNEPMKWQSILSKIPRLEKNRDARDAGGDVLYFLLGLAVGSGLSQ